MTALFERIARWVWVASYDLEHARERHAVSRQYLRSAACCVGLATLQAFERQSGRA